MAQLREKVSNDKEYFKQITRLGMKSQVKDRRSDFYETYNTSPVRMAEESALVHATPAGQSQIVEYDFEDDEDYYDDDYIDERYLEQSKNLAQSKMTKGGCCIIFAVIILFVFGISAATYFIPIGTFSGYLSQTVVMEDTDFDALIQGLTPLVQNSIDQNLISLSKFEQLQTTVHEHKFQVTSLQQSRDFQNEAAELFRKDLDLLKQRESQPITVVEGHNIDKEAITSAIESRLRNQIDEINIELKEIRRRSTQSDASSYENDLYQKVTALESSHKTLEDELHQARERYEDIGSTERIGVLDEKFAKLERKHQELVSYLNNLMNDFEKSIKEIREELTEHAKSEHVDRVETVVKNLQTKTDNLKNNFEHVKLQVNSHSGVPEGVPETHRLKKIVTQVIDQDRTGKIDWAALSVGGSVLTYPSRFLHHGYDDSQPNIFTKIANFFANWLTWGINPSIVITPVTGPGNCYPFISQAGNFTIQLREPIFVTGFSYEHISVTLNPRTDSTPKIFKIYALEPKSDRFRRLVLLENDSESNLTYISDENQPALQYFKFKKTDFLAERIFIHVVSNYGSKNFTCIYRFRIHGEKIND